MILVTRRLQSDLCESFNDLSCARTVVLVPLCTSLDEQLPKLGDSLIILPPHTEAFPKGNHRLLSPLVLEPVMQMIFRGFPCGSRYGPRNRQDFDALLVAVHL